MRVHLVVHFVVNEASTGTLGSLGTLEQPRAPLASRLKGAKVCACRSWLLPLVLGMRLHRPQLAKWPQWLAVAQDCCYCCQVAPSQVPTDADFLASPMD